ncbi:3'-5' exoribonuclease [Cupriavidus sp. BIS7]|uniref:3'-5' exoribonuclease n=1 Tax=Cupriavidus sp. BIS7 TaxID=1217718 RepID=UPI00037D8605|nr:3'-5' exoribonuclease [Cupriavidus sp. BIS7]
MTDTRFHDGMNWSRSPESHNSWGNRYFIDTEFSDFHAPEVLSIAIVGENGLEFYGERTDYIEARCSDFVRAVVVPQFGRFEGRAMILDDLSQELREWVAGIPVGSKPVLCYDHAVDVDMLRFLLNGQLPNGWAFEKVSGQIDAARRAAYFLRYGGEHHALHDARANAYACGF